MSLDPKDEHNIWMGLAVISIMLVLGFTLGLSV